MIKWRTFKDEQPADGMECLTVMKHGMISGFYDAADKEFHGYYWHDMIWRASKWVPLTEITQEDT